jgi:hypothetical protein
MRRFARADLVAVMDSLLLGRVGFERVRQFVFQYLEGEGEVQLDDDLELVFTALGPYLEHEEAYGDDERMVRMCRLRDALSAAGAPVERTVWALEFDRVRDLQRRFDAGVITRTVFETQLRELSPAEFDMHRVAFWATAYRQDDERVPHRVPPSS